MRKLIVSNFLSLDGYYEGPDKDVTALFDFRTDADRPDESIELYSAERLREADTMLFGHTTFKGFKDTWPSVVGDKEASSTQRDISSRLNAIEKLVIADSLLLEDTGPWRDTTRIIRRADAHDQLAEAKAQDGRDILVQGSHILWNDLLAYGLVDELHLMFLPVAVGQGTPVFTEQVKEALLLVNTRRFEGSENIVLRYKVKL